MIHFGVTRFLPRLNDAQFGKLIFIEIVKIVATGYGYCGKNSPNSILAQLRPQTPLGELSAPQTL